MQKLVNSFVYLLNYLSVVSFYYLNQCLQRIFFCKNKILCSSNDNEQVGF